jgi:hypothetical protein
MNSMPQGKSLAAWKRALRRFPGTYAQVVESWWHVKRLGLQAIGRLIPASVEFGPPRGWFSMAEQVRRGEVPGKIILEQQPAPQPGKVMLRQRAPLEQHLQHPWPIFGAITSRRLSSGQRSCCATGANGSASKLASAATSFETIRGFGSSGGALRCG